MIEFKDRVSKNNKQKLKIYNSSGVLQETKSVEVLRDSTIEDVTEEGTPLNAATFNAMMGEVYDTVTLKTSPNSTSKRVSLKIVPEEGNLRLQFIDR